MDHIEREHLGDHDHHRDREVHGRGPAHDHTRGHGGAAHGQVRGSPPWVWLARCVSDLSSAHSHDDAGQLDAALEADAAGRRALLRSLVILAAAAAVELAVVGLSGSVALLGDGLHNLADASSAVPLLVAFGLARRPPTKRFTYGYGRAEDVAGLFIVAVIALSSALAAFESIDRLFHPRHVGDLWAVAAAALVGFAGNELVARYRIRVGHRIGSAALVADGLHARVDGLASLAVLVGVGGLALGWPLADPLAGLVVTAAFVGVLRSAVRRVGARLLDAVDPRLVDQVDATVKNVPGVICVREVRMRWVGHSLRAEIDATVAATLSVTEAHDVAHRAEGDLHRRIARLAGASVHVSPAGAHSQPTVT